MEPSLRSLTLLRFRSIPREQVEFSNPTFLVGQNGSGKSNLVDALAFLAEVTASPLQAVFDRRGGVTAVRNQNPGRGYPPNLGLAVELERLNGDVATARYAFEIAAVRDYGFEVVREQCRVQRRDGALDWFERRKGREFRSSHAKLAPALEANALALPVVGGDSRFSAVLKFLSAMRVYSIDAAKLRDMQDPDDGTQLKRDGSNAASVLRVIERESKATIERLREILASIVPNTTDVRTKKHGNKLALEFKQKWREDRHVGFESFSMSDGTLRTLGLLTAVYQRPSPALIVIEEPDAAIHPGALGAILDLLKEASERMQVVVTTHSPELLDADWIGPENLRVVAWRDGASRISEPSAESKEAIQSHLMGPGELLRSNALRPRADLFDEHPEFPRMLFVDEEPA